MADKEGTQTPGAQGAHDPSGSTASSTSSKPQISLIPNAPQVPPALKLLHLPTPHVPLSNWSHFKPKYSGKPDKDADAHLLRTNDWMDTHGFQDYVMVQRFCLTLTGEARLWYKSL